jgi:hypothetical protein
MKIEFDKNVEEFKRAHKLRQLLDHCDDISTEESTRHLLSTLKQQIDNFLVDSDFDKFRESLPLQIKSTKSKQGKTSLLQLLFGPSRREITLSKQRKELIERAEHAESIAFEALAETADVGRERDDVIKKIKELEEEIIKLKAGN